MKIKSINPSTRITVATLIGFVAMSCSILLIPLLLTDQASRNIYFWQRIAWTEFYAVLIWAYIGGFFSLVIPKKRSIRGLGAVLPGLGIAIFFYSISSFIFMMLAAYYPQLQPFNMISRVYRTVGLVIIMVFLFFSWVSGTVGAEAIPKGVKSPQDLTISLQSQENKLFAQYNNLLSLDRKNKVSILRNSLKSLRERIQYSIPHVGSIGSDITYINFSKEVIQLCEDFSKLDVQTMDVQNFESLILQVSDLSGRVQGIAQNLRN